MLVFISPRFVISDFCLKEVNLADLLRLPIIPVMIEKTPWPPPGSLAMILSQHIYIDLAGTGGHGGCGRDADWSMKMREMIRRLRLYTNPVSGNRDLVSIDNKEPMVEAVEAAAPVGSSAPPASEVMSASEENVTESFETEETTPEVWGQADPGRVPCCVNALYFPSICAIL